MSVIIVKDMCACEFIALIPRTMEQITISSKQHWTAAWIKFMLLCGVLSSALYAVMNVIAALLYNGYDPINQTVSELSAIGAPTRSLWVVLAIVYSVLTILFGIGVYNFGTMSKSLRMIGRLLIISAVIGLFWPPMHQRTVLAAGGGTLTDTLHIVFTAIEVPLMILIIAIGAGTFGKGFKWYSILTLIALIFFGILTGIESPNIQTNGDTPMIGVWERLNIGAYMTWIMVFSIRLVDKLSEREQGVFRRNTTR